MGENGTKRLSASDVLRRSTSIYREHLVKLWAIALVFILPLEVLALFFEGPITFWIWLVLSIPTGAWMIGSIVNLTQAAEEASEPIPGLGSLLWSVWPRLAALSLLSFITMVAITLGTGFFIVPGVALALFWVVAPTALVIEGIGVSSSLYRSIDLTKGNRTRILPLVIAFFVGEALSLGLGFVLVEEPVLNLAQNLIYSVLAYPLVVVVSTVLYLELAGAKGRDPGSDSTSVS